MWRASGLSAVNQIWPAAGEIIGSFSIECRETNTKVITLANHKGHIIQWANQSDAFDWLGKWRRYFKAKTKHSNVLNPTDHVWSTFNAEMKTALLSTVFKNTKSAYHGSVKRLGRLLHSLDGMLVQHSHTPYPARSKSKCVKLFPWKNWNSVCYQALFNSPSY